MKLNLTLRDKNIKCKKLRRNNLATGTLKRNTEIVPISVKGSDMDKYIRDNGFNKVINIDFHGEILKVKIIGVKRDLIIHNIINVDFEETV